MKAGMRKIVPILVVSALLFMVMPMISIADSLPNPPPVPTLPPTPSPSNGGGGNGGSSGGSYGTAGFQPYIVDLMSTDGTIIGNFTVLDQNDVKLWAEKTLTIDGANYTVRLTADMDSLPASPQLDIVADQADVNDLFTGNYNGVATVNITKYSKDGVWSLRTGTVHLYITATGDALQSKNVGNTFYLLENDDKGNILVYDAVPDNLGGAMTTFDSSLLYEPNSPSNTGKYTLVGKSLTTPVSTVPTQQPVTASATAQPNATGVPTAVENTSGGETSFILVIGSLIAGLVIGFIVAFVSINLINKK